MKILFQLTILLLFSLMLNGCDKNAVSSEPDTAAHLPDAVEKGVSMWKISDGDTLHIATDLANDFACVFESESGLITGHSRSLQFRLPGVHSTGKYTLSIDTGLTVRTAMETRDSIAYRCITGWIDITLIDRDFHKFSATFDVTMIKSGMFVGPDTIRYIGRYDNVQLIIDSAESRGKLTYNDGPNPYPYKTNLGQFYQRQGTLHFGAGFQYFDGGMPGALISVGVSFSLTDPAVGTRQPDAKNKWKFSRSRDPQRPSEPGSEWELPAGPNDELVVTEFDAARRIISGTFTINGLAGTFDRITWLEVP